MMFERVKKFWEKMWSSEGIQLSLISCAFYAILVCIAGMVVLYDEPSFNSHYGDYLCKNLRVAPVNFLAIFAVSNTLSMYVYGKKGTIDKLGIVSCIVMLISGSVVVINHSILYNGKVAFGEVTESIFALNIVASFLFLFSLKLVCASEKQSFETPTKAENDDQSTINEGLSSGGGNG